MDARISQIRSVLDALARVEKSDNDTKEKVYDRELAKIRALEREKIVDIMKRAVGSDKRRQKYSPSVFAELYDVPGIDTVFRKLLLAADSDGRAEIIQTIGLRKMRGLVGVLNDHFVRESDDFCRFCLLNTLSKLADESSLPIFEYLMRRADPRDEWRLIWAGAQYGRPEFHDYLLSVFQKKENDKSHRVVAAWGLAKLGEEAAYRYLIDMLDDPDVKTATTFAPGESMRAAQAIADVNGWLFEWDKDFVEVIRQRLAGSD